MFSEPKRARRRRDLDRMKAKARRVYPDVPKAPHWADYLAVCSCYVCNPHRRFHGLTIQERRATSVND